MTRRGTAPTGRRWLGLRPAVIARCGSTNDEAAALARNGGTHGIVVIAREQTAGRGRAGHRWHSPAGDNLYLSALLRPALPISAVPPITLAAGVAIHEAVNSLGVGASLKWPNDLFVHGRKVAGILTEMSSREGNVEHVVVGIGVNVNSRAFPAELGDRATSLRLALGDRPVDLARFTGVLLDRLERWLDRFFAGGAAAVTGAWEERAGGLGRRVRITGGEAPLDGVADGLDPDGALRVIADDGRVHRVVAGEVEAV